MKTAIRRHPRAPFTLGISLLVATLLLSGTYVILAKPPEPAPATKVQIVNATSVPAISLKVNGQVFYPKFRQGMQSGEFLIHAHQLSYTVSDLSTSRQVTQEIMYEKNTYQSLVITGDFRPVLRIRNGRKPVLEPYVEFNLLSHQQPKNQQPLRYRFLNGLSSKNLTIEEAGQAWVIQPGQLVSFHGQPPVKLFTVQTAEASMETLIRQDSNPRNCTVVFYEKEGKVTFMRIFENVPPAS